MMIFTEAKKTFILRRGHVSYFSCHSHSLSHSAFAMFILQLWTELEGKHCKSTMTKTKTKTGKIRYMPTSLRLYTGNHNVFPLANDVIVISNKTQLQNGNCLITIPISKMGDSKYLGAWFYFHCLLKCPREVLFLGEFSWTFFG